MMTDLSPEVASRLAFSYESMLHASSWLLQHNNSQCHDVGEWNAHVDSFLLHARRLHAVLSNTRQREDDLIISDILPETPEFILPETEPLVPLMNKRVLHLTTHNEPDTVEWPVQSISKELAEAMDDVIDSLADTGSVHYDRLLQARNSHPVFRKLVM